MAKYVKLAAFVLGVVALHQTASACNLVCTKAASASEITSYPSTVEFQLTVSCPEPGGGDTIWKYDEPLSPGAFDSYFEPVPGLPGTFLTVSYGAPRVLTYKYTFESFAQCDALAPAGPQVSSPTTIYILHAGGTYTCSTTVTCVPPTTGNGATRTIGFWKTHVDALEACVAGGINLGFTNVTTVGQALALLWANPSSYSGLDRARLLLGRQMIAAECNASMFGALPTTFILSDATTLLGTTDCGGMNALYPLVDAFNNLNDQVTFPTGFDPGASYGVGARGMATSTGLPGGSCGP